MKLKFKKQPYQLEAVAAVVDCFEGQPQRDNLAYRIDPDGSELPNVQIAGFGNAGFAISEEQILKNIQDVQSKQSLPVSQSLNDFKSRDPKSGRLISASADYVKTALGATPYHFDIEMETGTGKTYCYIKTIFDMNERYGWSKFIVMVPSIAIREGVYKSLTITADHFIEHYGKKARFFIYNSKRLHELESFSSDAGINIMVINTQAFNTADSRRIYEELDDFQSRKPIDVIAMNRPILILDEPQKMGGRATMETLPKFKPLMILRYSATHRTQHNLIHRLDAIDAYNQKLVKKIAVRGIHTRGLTGNSPYMYLETINISRNKAPTASIELEVKKSMGEPKRQLRLMRTGESLFEKSGKLEQYRNYNISQIDYRNSMIEFSSNLDSLKVGEAIGDMPVTAIRRIQIRETIKAHFDKEMQLFSKGIKVLSLFFIDKVVNYRDYSQPDENGEFARIFEEEYKLQQEKYLADKSSNNQDYLAYLRKIEVHKTHKGYFSIDKRTNLLKDPGINRRTNESDDAYAYDLILKDKEKLLSLDEPTRFIFSHSALREGWDNPNVFVMCMLKRSNNEISRRQEVGRGLRLCVDQRGNRMDELAEVHDINTLTVVANESYRDFVDGLQKEISENLTTRPRHIDTAYFTGKPITIDEKQKTVDFDMARRIYNYLVRNNYIDDNGRFTHNYKETRLLEMSAYSKLAELPKELNHCKEEVLRLIEEAYNETQMPMVEDAYNSKKNPLNNNFKRKEFMNLWEQINHKAVYRVSFDSGELIDKCVAALNNDLRVISQEYIVDSGEQKEDFCDKLSEGKGFTAPDTKFVKGVSIPSSVKYDLVGKIAEISQITRKTSANILKGIKPTVFGQFKQNPEHFIVEASRLITEQKATMVIEHLTYDKTNEQYSVDIFTKGQLGQDFARASDKLTKHIYDYAITDSKVEKQFAEDLESNDNVIVYAKLPSGFQIPTPVGNYNPDWAVSLKEGVVVHIYFIAETKGTLSSMELRGTEKAKINCAKKFFEEISQDRVKYDVVTNFLEMMDIVKNDAGVSQSNSIKSP